MPFFLTEVPSELDQTGTGYQHTSGIHPMFEQPSLGHPGNAGSQSGGSAMCSDPTRPLGANMAYPPHDFNLHISPMLPPSVNHGSNPPISSHTFAPQHQRGTGVHPPTNNLSQNNFGAIPFFHHTGYTNLIDFADPMQQNQPSGIARNGQSTFPAFGTWGVDGG